ncbi:MAG: transporter substrate-binding domain-containing protein [Clostridia bacterium]|nr:transporter substrate-binding domain-containing protein [Clostridia bacterium]
MSKKTIIKIASVVLALVLGMTALWACGGEEQDTIKIGVQTNTTGHIYSSTDFGEDAVVSYDNGAVAVEALKNGKVDCVIIDNEPAKSYVAANTGLKILETEYAVEDYAICFQKGNTELKDSVNGALKALIADGSVKKIVDKYINKTGEALVGVPVAAEDTEKPNLVMATNAEFPPYEYIDGDMYYGIDVEVAKIIADKLGYDLVIENVAFDSIIPGVQAGKYSMGMAGMTVNEERLEQVEFSDSYATGVQAVIVSESSKIQSIDDLDPYYLPAE